MFQNELNYLRKLGFRGVSGVLPLISLRESANGIEVSR
jgi:hypothetical protein